MRSALSFAWCLVVLGLSACSSSRETAQTGTNFCFNCHSETSALGIKIKWAEAGYQESRHGVGALNPITAPVPPSATGGICPPFAVAAANATCAANGGTTTSTATAAGVCTMPAITTPALCAAAGGLFFFSGVSTTPVNPAAGLCPPFAQAAALQGAPSATISPNNCTNIFGAAAYVAPLCTPPTTATQSGCEAAGGTFNGAKTTIVGYEREGSRSFNLNGFGCQICHTQEGWRDRLSGAYDTASLKVSYDPKAHTVSWDPSAWYTKDTVTLFVPNGITNSNPALPASVSPLAADTILRPSPLGCFGCHTPHGIGTTDNQTLDQTIPPGTTAVTTMAGSVWGNASTQIVKGKAPKDKGQICASCHQIRLNQFSSVSNLLVKTIQGAPPFTAGGTIVNPATGQPYPFSQTTFSFPNPHDSPVADMLLGNGGAEYAGGTVIRTGAGAPSGLTFGGTYTNSAHATLAGADCVSCHMQSDYSDFEVTNRFGLSPAVGGHSFANKGIVFGNAAASPFGCGSCHTVANVVGSTGTAVVASRIGASTGVKPSPTAAFGYLQTGFPVLLKGTDSGGGVVISSSTSPTLVNFKDSQYHLKINEILMKLANPDTGCSGLFVTAAKAAVPPLTLSSSYTFGVQWGPGGACGNPSLNTAGAALDPTAVDDGTNIKVRLAKAVWNFSFVLNDQSFGAHNTKYAGQLLYDSCVDLAVMAGVTCTSATSCEACNGTFVTSRASF